MWLTGAAEAALALARQSESGRAARPGGSMRGARGSAASRGRDSPCPGGSRGRHGVRALLRGRRTHRLRRARGRATCPRLPHRTSRRAGSRRRVGDARAAAGAVDGDRARTGRSLGPAAGTRSRTRALAGVASRRRGGEAVRNGERAGRRPARRQRGYRVARAGGRPAGGLTAPGATRPHAARRWAARSAMRAGGEWRGQH